MAVHYGPELMADTQGYAGHSVARPIVTDHTQGNLQPLAVHPIGCNGMPQLQPQLQTARRCAV